VNDPPAGPLDADLARLRLITRARANGATWAHIGRTLGLTGPQAKHHTRHLARTTGRRWRLLQNQEDQATEHG
jgi:hypothetical protein